MKMTAASATAAAAAAAAPTSNAQLRKIKKPLIERRRRERINECLTQLKTLVLEAMNRDESCYSKMEKADILEMTVTHLKNIQLNPISSSPSSSSQEDARKKYLLGFNECAKEVGHYLSSSMEELAAKVGGPLMKHLVSCLENIQRYQVGVMTVGDPLPPTAGGKPENPEGYSISFVATPGTLSDFSGSVRPGVGTAVPVAFNMEPYTAMLAFCDGLRSVGKLSPSAASDVTENSSVGSTGMSSRWRTTSFSDDGSTSELLGSSNNTPACRSIFPIPSLVYSADSQISRRFVSSVPALIPAQIGMSTGGTGSPVKNEVLPSDGSSVWRPW